MLHAALHKYPQTVDINWHMHADDEVQLQNVPRNFFHWLLEMLVLLFFYIETFAAALALAFWITWVLELALIDLVGRATYFA